MHVYTSTFVILYTIYTRSREMDRRAATKQIKVGLLAILLLTFVRYGSSQTEYIAGSPPPLPTNGKFYNLIELQVYTSH